MAISPRRMLSKQVSGVVETPRTYRKNTRICMELVWNLYGTCMELVWNMYGTTRLQHASNTLSTRERVVPFKLLKGAVFRAWFPLGRMRIGLCEYSLQQ